MLTALESAVLRRLVFSSDGNGHDFGLWYTGSAGMLGIPMSKIRGVITTLQTKGLIEDWTPLTKADGADPRVLAQFTLADAVLQLAEKADASIRCFTVDEGRYPERGSCDLLVDFIEKHGLVWDSPKFEALLK